MISFTLAELIWIYQRYASNHAIVEQLLLSNRETIERKKKQRFTSIEKYTNRLTETKWHDELRSCTLVHGALYAITCNLIFAPRERVHYLSRHPARLHPFARTSMIILPGLMHRVAKCSMRFKCRGIVKYPVYGS